MTAHRVMTHRELIIAQRGTYTPTQIAQGYRRLDHDAPLIPPGLRVLAGVDYGCGEATCRRCYEPLEGGTV